MGGRALNEASAPLADAADLRAGADERQGHERGRGHTGGSVELKGTQGP